MKTFQLILLSVASISLSAAPLFAQEPSPAPAPASASPSGSAATNLDFGDFKSSTLASKAWEALNAKDYASAIGYTTKCIDTYKDKAVEMQKSITTPPTEKDQIFSYWALNDVGTCYFIRAKAYDEQSNTKDALGDYKFLADNLGYAKCWDPKGWFWSPAGAAKERVAALQFDSIK